MLTSLVPGKASEVPNNVGSDKIIHSQLNGTPKLWVMVAKGTENVSYFFISHYTACSRVTEC